MELRNEIKAGALACPVWPDNGVDTVALNLEVDIIDGNKAQKLFAKVPRFQNKVS